jgi:hypothetical protein
MEENTLITRLLVIHGAPEHTEDIESFVEEYRRALAPFGPNVLLLAGDRIIRNGGQRWPTVRECLSACRDVQEEEAAKAQASEGNAPRKKYPWDENHERAMQWSVEFMNVSEAAREAMDQGWADKLRGYARSYARFTLNSGKQLPAAASWMPPKDVLADYRRNR